MHFLRYFTLSLCLCGLHGQTLQTASQDQSAKLADAIQRLNAQRADIQQQQIPLAQELRALEAQSADLKDDLAKIRRVRDSRDLDLNQLKETVAAQRKEYDYIMRTLFNEYISTYESMLSTGELKSYGETARALNLFLEAPEATEPQRLERYLELITESTQRLDSTIGGKAYSGQALNNDGLLVDGSFIQVGPLLYFKDASGSQAGVVEESTSLQPRMRSLKVDLNEQVISVAQAGEGLLPMDLSLGDALAVEATKDTVLEHLKKGGIWVYPIIGFALLSTLVALVKFGQIMTIRHPKPVIIHDLVGQLRDGNRAEALALAKAQPQPSRNMLVQAVQHADESIELVEESMYESLLTTQPRLTKYLNVIAVTASVAPLLGLLGTVTGIIKTFNLMKVFGAGDPKPLISGISEALITTELGLILAIPALIIHAVLSRRVAGVMAHTEKLSVALVNGLSRSVSK